MIGLGAWLGIAALAVFLVLGVPVGIAMLAAGLLGLFLTFGPDIAVNYLGTSLYRESASFVLATIPLFVLMGSLGSNGAVWERLFEFVYRIVGRVRGGIPMAIVAAGTLFGSVSGSSSADAAALSKVTIREAERYGYRKDFILACISAAATAAVMVPPSITLIVYALLTQTSVARLFAAGIVPGVLSALVLMCVIVVKARRHPADMPRGPRFRVAEQAKGAANAAPILVVVLAVIAGIYLGVYTPTEAAAVGVFGIGVIGAIIGRLRTKQLVSAAREAAETAAMIFLIIIGAFVFGRFMSINQIPQQIVQSLSDLPFGRYGILIVLLVVYLILGTFMDQLAVQVLTIPIVFPLITSLDFNPYWFAIVFVKTVEIGLITPPLGLNVYVVSAVAKVPIERAFRAIWPFVLADVCTLTLLVAFPQITLWLPNILT
ncbi:MAG: TRAP transporter large permease [Streptosporangiales bacterium]